MADAPATKPAKVKPPKVKPPKVKPPKVRPAKAKPAEVKAAEVKAAEVEPSKIRSAEVKPAKVRSAEVKPAKVRSAEVKADKVRPAEVKADKAKAAKAKAAKVRPARPSRKSTITAIGDRVPASLVVLGLLLLALLFFPFLSMVTSLPNAQHAALLSRQTLDALWTTILAGGAAIILDAVFGIPLAYWMAKSRSWLRHLALVAALLPLAVPPIVGGLELVLWLGPYGWLGRLLDHVGLNPLDTLRGTILAQMFVAAPFVIVAARAGFASVEPSVTDAARTLGCGAWRTLIRVTLPAARRGIVAGLILGLLRAVGEFGTSIIVAYHPYTLANLAYVQLSEQGLRAALPTGVLLAALGAAAGLALLALDSDRRRRPGAILPPAAPRLASLSWIARKEPPAAAREAAGGQAAAAAAEPAAMVKAGPDLVVQIAGQVGSFALDVTLEAPATAVAILGSSGAGKSLTIRTMAGLLRPPAGKVVMAGRCLLDIEGGIAIPAERRSLGYVSQDGALFRHLDVEGNVAFGLRGLAREERRQRVEELLQTFGLTSLRYARPQTLSGGERQQVALARAIAPGPRALLLDEPFSNLDAGLRRSLREIVRGIYEATGVPFVLVTHDRDDALDLADYVVAMDGGRVIQQGKIEEVFSRPANRTVARLVGIPNIVPVSGITRPGPRGAAHTAWGDIRAGGLLSQDVAAWELAVPPDGARLSFNGAPPTGVVASVRPGATDWRVVVRPLADGMAGGSLVVAVPRSGGTRPVEGAACSVTLDPQRCHMMPVERLTPPPSGDSGGDPSGAPTANGALPPSPVAAPTPRATMAIAPPAPEAALPSPPSEPPSPVPEPPTPVSEPPTPVSVPPTPVSVPPTPVSEPPTPVSEPPTPEPPSPPSESLPTPESESPPTP